MSHKTTFSGRRGKFLISLLAALILTTGLATPFTPVRAEIFNPHFIISDAEMRNTSTMTVDQIADFLNSKGKLNTFSDIDPNDQLLKSTAQLVADASVRYNINPKYLLVLIQKESGLVESKAPPQKLRDWATGYGLCDGCYKSSPLAQKYKGLAKQIDAGAGWIDWFFNKSATLSYLYKPGRTYTISKTAVTPTNTATAALYSYTPHISGNKLFFNIWQRWFGSTEQQQISAATIPDGAVVKNTKTHEYSVVQGGKFREVKYTSLIGTRFSATGIISLADSEYKAMTQNNPGKPITFADFSLVRVENGSIYLLVGNTRRLIVSAEAFAKIGFNPEEVEDATYADIAQYLPGPDITLNATEVETKLVQDATGGGIYYVQGGFKHPLWDKALLTVNFPGKEVQKVTTKELDSYVTADPVRFLDGTLVKAPGNPTVYMISNGKKRAITTEAVFLGLGFSWSSVINTTSQMLNLHELGEPILLPPEFNADGIQTASL